VYHLIKVIHLTKELLHASNEGAKGPGQLGEGASVQKIVAAITEAPEVKVPSVLPPQIKDQIRKAQQKAALAGHAPAEWAIGSQCQAKFGGDGSWYDATVTAISTSGKFIVTYTTYQTQDEVGLEDVRNIEEQYDMKKKESEYKGLSAPKLNTVREANAQAMADEPPAWMQIKPSDDEKTKVKKKKLLKSFKSKQRFQKMDEAQKKKADDWKNFLSSKISKKKKVKNRSVL
jgi:survival-of-motor-neuron-related-splicing factor 30